MEKVCSRMLALKDKCVHPTSQQQYIKSVAGGADNSPEEIQVCIFLLLFPVFPITYICIDECIICAMLRQKMKGGITHAFVMEFANAEDRAYYVSKDPAHQAFMMSLGGIVEKAQVIDFTNQVY